jgi:protein-disulfide isomerase
MRKGFDKKIGLLAIWLVLLGGLLVWINHSAPPPPPTPPHPNLPHPDPATVAAQWPQVVAHAAAPARGNPNARYTIAEFGDFQCPQCGKARPLLEKMLAQYPAQVNLIFIHRPFPNLHEWALPAGQASEIAAAQGKFWPMYDVLYSHQDDLETGFYGDYAAKAGLNKDQFEAAFKAGTGKDKVAASSSFADSLKVQLTPTMMVHDNVAHTVTIYVGMDTKMNATSGTPFPGIDQLVAHPPWVKTAQALTSPIP